MTLRPPHALLAALALAGLGGAPALAASDIVLSPAQIAALGIRTAPLAGAGGQAVVATLPAQFVPPPSGRSAVSAPFTGSVTRVEVVEGQAVRAGQVLATVFSREALNEQAGLGQARADAEVADAAAARQRRLANEGIVAAARAEEAEARARAARAALNARQVSVRAAGAGAGGAYSLRAPFTGRVSSVQVSVGQGIEAMATAFVVDRGDRIQVQAALPANLVGKVAPGARVRVEGVDGKLVAVGAEIDPRTRSLSLRAELPVRPSFLPGRATRIELFGGGATGGAGAPKAAVTLLGKDNVVFVRTAKGFRAQAVTLQGYSGDTAMVSGLSDPKAQVAVTGVSELKARAQAQ